MIISSTKIHFYLIPLDSTQYYRIYDVNIYKILGHKSVKVLVAQLCLTRCDPCTAVNQAPLSMESSRQEYWSGLPFPSPGDPPSPGIEPGFTAWKADFSFFFFLLSEPLTRDIKMNHNSQSNRVSPGDP